MAWSMLNLHYAETIKNLLDDIEKSNEGRPEFTPSIPREQVESIIHALIWAMSSRSSDFASAYAFDALANAIGIDLANWIIKKHEFDQKCKESTNEQK